MTHIPVPIIIVGQPKAGTSSLFNWLAQHDQICASNIKETRFFIDSEYPLPHSNKKDISINNYLKFFETSGQKFILEATPDYLYNKTPLNLHSIFKNVIIIIIKRDPVDRLFSFFRYHKQQGIISSNMTFDEYIDNQIQRKHDRSRPLYLRSLEHSSEKYIHRYKEIYRENCILIEFNDLCCNPRLVMDTIFQKLDLNSTKHSITDFSRINKTTVSRNQSITRIYRYISGFIRYRVHKQKSLMKVLRPVSKYIRYYLYSPSSVNKDLILEKTIKKINTELERNLKIQDT